MKRNSRGILIAAVLLLSAGMVWQQQRRAALPPDDGAGTADGTNAAGSAPSTATGGGTSVTLGQGKPSAAVPGNLPAPSAATPGSTSPSPLGATPVPIGPAAPNPNTAMPLEPLISQAGKQALIARDGTPLRLELSPGNPATAVELQAWTDDQARNAEGRYDWRFKINVPGGGLVERKDPAVFTASEGGYSPAFDYAMDQSLPADQWSNSLSKSFFVHFQNDTYAMLNVQLVAGGAHFVTVKAYLNPATGSRNLQPPPRPPVKMR